MKSTEYQIRSSGPPARAKGSAEMDIPDIGAPHRLISAAFQATAAISGFFCIPPSTQTEREKL